MAGHAPEVSIKEIPNATIAIISATWHDDICADLIKGAQRACALAKAKSEVIRVPGSFELPLAAQFAFEKGFDAAVVLGVVIQGETPHFDYVCQGVTQGVIDVSLKFSRAGTTAGKSLSTNWRCSASVAVATNTFRPCTRAGTMYASDFPVPVPA